MAVGCGPKCSKLLLFIFNLVFWLSGAAILGVGLWFLMDPSVYNTLRLVSPDPSDTFIDFAIYLLIGTGSFIFIAGFLGCCGALRENKCMLGLYVFLLIIIMAAEVGVGVLTFLKHGQLEEKVPEDLKTHLHSNVLAINDNGTVQYSTFATLLMYSQYSINCCGIDSPTDYKGLNISKLGVPVLPTCCRMNPSFKADPRFPNTSKVADWATCKKEAENYFKDSTSVPTQLFTMGCKDKLITLAKDKAKILIALGFGVALLELFGIIFACCLYQNIKDDY